jgi:hypothetical protein
MNGSKKLVFVWSTISDTDSLVQVKALSTSKANQLMTLQAVALARFEFLILVVKVKG